MNQVLILGGYGNFGARITAALVKNNISVIIAGRELQKAKDLQNKLKNDTAYNLMAVAAFDANKEVNKYIDLADARDFVTGIACLDSLAKKIMLLQ
jgi:uncharacterized protein YbjT (DUF2867 family)